MVSYEIFDAKRVGRSALKLERLPSQLNAIGSRDRFAFPALLPRRMRADSGEGIALGSIVRLGPPDVGCCFGLVFVGS